MNASGNATAQGSFNLLDAGATASSSLAVGIDTSTAGHKTGTATIALASNGQGTSGLGTKALDSQTVDVSGDVYRLASAGPIAAVQFGNAHVGDAASQALGLTNTAADGYSEKLDGSFSGASDARILTSGSVSQLGAGATDATSLVIGLDTSTAGALSGTAQLHLFSNGAGTSGLGFTDLGTRDVGVTTNVAVYRYAAAQIANSQPIDFSAHRVGEVATAGVSVTTTAAADGYSEALDGSAGLASAGFTVARA